MVLTVKFFTLQGECRCDPLVLGGIIMYHEVHYDGVFWPCVRVIRMVLNPQLDSKVLVVLDVNHNVP